MRVEFQCPHLLARTQNPPFLYQNLPNTPYQILQTPPPPRGCFGEIWGFFGKIWGFSAVIGVGVRCWFFLVPPTTTTISFSNCNSYCD